ncbi:MAG: LicD family protein [Bacteroidales bacterium]|nr:LicD family protein [Bacteroidales bacterium]
MNIKKAIRQWGLKHWGPRVRKQQMLKEKGAGIIGSITEFLEKEGVDCFLEFGTLLGMYRDKDFIKSDDDIDFGAWLKDAPVITRTMLAHGYTLRREYHLIGGLGMEQTFRNKDGMNIDFFYYEPEGDHLAAYGFRKYQHYRHHKASFFKVSKYIFKTFTVAEASFKGVRVKVPANTEEHIMEVYGPGYKVYDPHFKHGGNKTMYEFNESGFAGVGFRKGMPTK